jgi:hypothetical protein
MRFLMLAELLLIVAPIDPPRFEVTNKCPAFEVTNKMPAAKPADPRQPAPAGYQWQRWPGEPWKLVKPSRVEVPAARPFY